MIQNPVLTIAGFDNSGGAGLQADLKVFSAFGCYGMSVVTAIAVQNTTGVKNCHMIPLEIIEQQLISIVEDIPPSSIKIGMLFNENIIDLVCDFIKKYTPNIPIVLDPVMVAKSGDALLQPEAVDALRDKLLPLATIITPNLPEALTLLGETDTTIPQETIAKRILDLQCRGVLVKGGHYTGVESQDLLMTHTTQEIFSTKRIATKNTHGTGCTLSAAIAACLAQDYDLTKSVSMAKQYLTEAIKSAASTNVGLGAGPTDHFWFLDQPCSGKLH